MSEEKINNNIINAINNTMKKEIDDLYIKYEEECIKNLKAKLELKKPEVVSKILESTNIIMEQDSTSLIPTIKIKIEYIH